MFFRGIIRHGGLGKVMLQIGLDTPFDRVGMATMSFLRMRQFQALLGLSFAIVILSGCGGDPNVATVSGLVTLDGEPLDRVSVLFQPEKGGRPSFGVTDEQGRYKLTYSRTQKGASVGSCIVKVTKLSDVGDDDGKAGKNEPVTTVKIPDRYSKEPITVTVLRMHNTIDLDLTSEP